MTERKEMKMKKYFIITLVIMLLLVLTSCDYLSAAGTSEAESDAPADEVVTDEAVTAEEEQESTPPTESETEYEPETELVDVQQSDNAALEVSFTIEQLERAMYPQWNFGGEPDITNSHIISAQRVERESDYVWFESAGQYIDASNAVRYRMEVRHRELYFEWRELDNGFSEVDTIIGDYITSIIYRDFNVENGEPKLLFVSC